MSRWFRHYAGMCSDPKFGGIARRAKVSRDRAVFIFAFILENAAEKNDGGSFDWDADALADVLNCETVEIERVHAELAAAGLIAGCQVAKWSSRQYEDKTNAERQARFKDKKKAACVSGEDGNAGNAPVTQTDCVSNAPHRQSTDTDTEEAATAASSAGAAKIDLKEVERRCVQATGWHSTDGFSAIEELITEGHDLDDRILPMLRTIAGELKSRGKPAPDRWAFVLKTVRDPSRRPMAEDKPVDMVWITEGSQGWKDLVQFGGKRESLLRMMLRTDGGGKEGLWWAVSQLPAQPVKQGAAA